MNMPEQAGEEADDVPLNMHTAPLIAEGPLLQDTKWTIVMA